MSYDLELRCGDPPPAEPGSADEREFLRTLASELRAASPGLDVIEPVDDGGFAIQLGYESGRSVVVDMLGVDEICLSWSYACEDARPALAEVRRYLPVLERHGYVVWDPQLQREFDPDRDAADALAYHRRTRERWAAEHARA